MHDSSLTPRSVYSHATHARTRSVVFGDGGGSDLQRSLLEFALMTRAYSPAVRVHAHLEDTSRAIIAAASGSPVPCPKGASNHVCLCRVVASNSHLCSPFLLSSRVLGSAWAVVNDVRPVCNPSELGDAISAALPEESASATVGTT